jgi:hypothetical protein
MTEGAVSFAGNLTDDPEVRYTERGIARAVFWVAVSGRREQEASLTASRRPPRAGPGPGRIPARGPGAGARPAPSPSRAR